MVPNIHLQWLLRSSLWLLSLLYHVAAYDPTPRWGQAVVLLNDSLYVYGGKVDPSNQYSFSSAPNTHEVLFLPLSSGFSAQSPPWSLVSSSTDFPTTLAWHTLSAFNTTHALLFGGLPDPNSQVVLVNLDDSAAIFDVTSHTSPVLISEPRSWGGQPVRRHRHSSTTSPTGQVFIIGGERPDGSQLGFADHFYFSGTTMAFHLLPTTNAPPDIFGHVSVILSDGRILVLGGYSPSENLLLPFSTIWVLDTSKMQWSIATIDSQLLPSPRVAFAATFIGSGKVIIQGGCDSDFQVNYADGWILDTTTNPWTWTKVDALSQIGRRRDHFALSYGGQVIFGFGYSDNGPAPSTLDVYSPPSNTFVPSYTPPPPGFTMTPTIPPVPPNSGAQPSPSKILSGSHSTPPPLPPSATNATHRSGSAAVIALGSVFGILGLVAAGLGIAYFVRRRRRRDSEGQFMALGDEGADIIGEARQRARPIPIANMRNAPSQLGFFGSMSAALKMKNVAPRRDMLADEDATSFREWYNRQKSVAGSTWSLKSILGGGMKPRIREHSSSSLPAIPLTEKDPFVDPDSVTRDERTGLISLTARTPKRHSRRERTYHTWRSGSSYHDPFTDPIYDEDDFESADLYDAYRPDTPLEDGGTRSPVRPPLPRLQTVLPVSQGGHPLSPLSEHTSQTTLPSQRMTPSNSSHSHVTNDIPLNTIDSGLSSPSMPQRAATLLNASTPSLLSGSQPVLRNDPWWSRFAKSSLLERRSSGASRTAAYEIRDPNPPPTLSAIVETTSPQASTIAVTDEEKTLQVPLTSQSALYRPGYREQSVVVEPPSAIPSRVYGAEGHGKSLSSLKTTDSEAIDKVVGTMDVVHYLKSRNQSGNRQSMSGLSIETFSSGSASEHEDRHAATPRDGEKADLFVDSLIMFASPLESETSPTFRHPLAADQGDDPTLPNAVDAALPVSEKTRRSPVADRIRDFERRLSMELPENSTLTNMKLKEVKAKQRVEVKYGLAPKPSLFVANPDRERSGSGDS